MNKVRIGSGVLTFVVVVVLVAGCSDRNGGRELISAANEAHLLEQKKTCVANLKQLQKMKQ